ncbi:hypothetical protein KDK77_05090 [bacterium]|nr:hypothetical protein [bacterium]MCP5461730.1 hypothetical protein [bacterium]
MSKKPQTALAIIDIGAHSARMEIVQFSQDGEIQVLDNLSQPIFLGTDVFRNGKISASNMRHCTRVIRDFGTVMKEYGVEQYRAVATSAVREAINRDIFLNKIRTDTGINLTVLDPSEELKLLYLSVKKLLEKNINLKVHNAVLFSIGTGSTHFASIEKGNLKNIQFLKFGTLRLIDELSTEITPQKIKDVIDPFVSTMVDDVARMSPAKKSDLLILVGATVRSLVDIEQGKKSEKNIAVLSREKFYALFQKIAASSIDDLVKTYGISDPIACGLTPCCNLIDNLLKNISAESIIVPSINTRDILIKAELQRLSNTPDPFEKEIISSVEFIGEKYRYNPEHARTVADLALLLFDKMMDIHNLGQRERLMLEIATLLRDIGKFINSRQHHKHSFYIINNSAIPGFTDEERNIVATVARYHRKAAPSTSHIEYMSLSSENKVLVCKLASLLRLAGSLERTHTGKVAIKKLFHDEESLTIQLNGSTDLTKEQWLIKTQCGLFTDTFGLKIILNGQ